MPNIISKTVALGIKIKTIIGSAMRLMHHWRACLLLCGLVLTSTYVHADTDNTVDLYSYRTKTYLMQLPVLEQYRRLETQGKWDIIQFTKPVVPVWVYSDYVDAIDGNKLTVTANRLHVRNKPSLDAVVIGTLLTGYQSQIIERKPPFLQIYAPLSFSFAVLNGKSTETNKRSDLSLSSRVKNLENKELNFAWRYDKQNNVVEDESAKKQQTTSKVKTSSSTQVIAVDEPLNSDIGKPSQLVKPNTVKERRHRLSPGDIISLNVFGEPDLGLSKARVPESGVISFPLIGALDVANKTVNEVESQVKKQLELGYIKNPKLSITIDAYRPIFIKGAVISSGSFPYTEGLTIAKALALAGGVAKSANKQGVSVFRDDKATVSDLSIDSQYIVESGDVISVEEEMGVGQDTGLYVYLHGEVKTPGAYEYRKDLTVEKAVVLAGGFTLRASKKRIALSRAVPGQEAPEKKKRVKLYFPVEPGDIIDVGASWF